MLIAFVNLTRYYLKRCCGVKDFLLLMSVKKNYIAAAIIVLRENCYLLIINALIIR